jgi:hypothetical protein
MNQDLSLQSDFRKVLRIIHRNIALQIFQFKEALAEATQLKKLDGNVQYDPKQLLKQEIGSLSSLSTPSRISTKDSQKSGKRIEDAQFVVYGTAEEMAFETQLQRDLASLAHKKPDDTLSVISGGEDDVVETEEEKQLRDIEVAPEIKTAIKKDELLLKVRIQKKGDRKILIWKQVKIFIPKYRSAIFLQLNQGLKKRYLVPSKERKEFLLDWNDFERMCEDPV